MSTHDLNANRPGYKETKVGWIPEEWENSNLLQIALQSGGIKTGPFGSQLHESDYVETGIPVIMPLNMRDSKIVHSGIARVREEKACSLSNQRCKRGDILFARRGEIGRCALISEAEDGWLNGTGSLRVRLNQSKALPEFMIHAIRVPREVHWLNANAVGQTMLNLNAEIVASLSLPLPPILEQKKIAEILSTCDEVIEKTGDLIEAKKRQKKALMQQLLIGHNRLPGFVEEWEEVVLSDISNRLKKTAKKPGGYPVLSITAGRGFVSQADKFSRIIAGKQVEKYVVLKRGEFSYNKGNSYRYPQGCVYRLSEYDKGLVPNVFYSFRLIETRADAEFIKQYFLAGLHNKDLYRWINSGVRNNGLLNLNAADFFKLPIKLPPLFEQAAIGEILRNADGEIQLLEAKHAVLKQQKKALMQQLLTGHLRVKV